MATAQNQLMKRQAGCRAGYPIAAAVRLYEGTLAFVTSAGFLTDVTGSGANRLAGIVVAERDNSGGAAGDLKAEVETAGVFRLPGSGFSQASVGRAAYATDNWTVTEAPSASGVRIGTIKEFLSATEVAVELDPQVTNRGFEVQTKTADATLTIRDNGAMISSTGATGTVTIALPPAVPGLQFGFRVGAAQQLRIDPDGTETISLPSTGVPGAAGKYLVADAIGETVVLACVLAGTWSVLGFTGTWTAEA